MTNKEMGVIARVCETCSGVGFLNPNDSTGFAPYIYSHKKICPECHGKAWILKEPSKEVKDD